MSEISLLSEADCRACITLDTQSIKAVEQAFYLLATAKVAMPPILRLDVPEHNGEVDVKTAYLPGLEQFAIKVSPGFFDNPKLGLPSLNGLMLLLDSQTGLPVALLLDNGYLTAIRTAAAGAVAAKWLSRENATCAAVLGAGEQARLQLQALCLVRPIRQVRVWARDARQAQRYSREMSQIVKIKVTACQTIEAVLQNADIAITATPGTEPLIQAEHLHPGLHITAMGSDAPHKNEIAATALAKVDQYVADRLSQTRILGELHHAKGLLADENLAELGQIIAGQKIGRRSAKDITLCDLTGTGAQDTAIAALAWQRAKSRGKGLLFHN